MKLFVVATCLIAVTLAAPGVEPGASALRKLPALTQEVIRDELGQYTLHYITAEGTEINEKGRLVPTPDGNAYVLVVEGETKFIGDDEKVYTTKYSAGLDGYRVEGDHLPVPVVALPVPASTEAPKINV